jgi:hypothetical protein
MSTPILNVLDQRRLPHFSALDPNFKKGSGELSSWKINPRSSYPVLYDISASTGGRFWREMTIDFLLLL